MELTWREYYTLNGNLYHYNREAGGQPDLLVEPSDYASFSGGLLGVFDSAGIHLQEAALTGDKVYYRIDSCIQNDSVSIGWRTGYSRQYSALFEKDLETGTVTGTLPVLNYTFTICSSYDNLRVIRKNTVTKRVLWRFVPQRIPGR